MFKKVSDLLSQDLKAFKNSTSSNSWGQSRKTQGSHEFFDFLNLIAHWEKIVGTKLAKVTIPLKNQNKTLTILTNHSGYSQSLSMMEETLKEKIIKVFPELRGKIQRLNFIVNTTHFDSQRQDLLKRANVDKKDVETHKKHNELHPQSPQYKALKKEAQKELEHFEEGELKEQMISLYIQNKVRSQQ